MFEFGLRLLGVGKEAQQDQQHRIVGHVEEIGHPVREGIMNDNAAGGVVVEMRHRIRDHRAHRLKGDAGLLRLRHCLGKLGADVVENPEVRVRVI